MSVRETGILEGRGAGRVPTVRFVDAAQRFGVVQPGSPIVTAGGSLSLAPPDIVVGTVSRVKEGSEQQDRCWRSTSLQT